MYLWRISQNENKGYDTYDSAVVAAYDEEEARVIFPSPTLGYKWVDGAWRWPDGRASLEQMFSCWTTPDKVKVEYLGEASDDLSAGIVLSSFNAG